MSIADEARAEVELKALRSVVGGVLCNAMNFPEKVIPHLLGQNMGPLIDRTAEKILAAGYRKVEVTDAEVQAGVRALVGSWGGTVSTPDDHVLVRAILTAALGGE